MQQSPSNVDMTTIQTLASAKVELVVNYKTVWGGSTVVLEPSDVGAFLRDRDQWVADSLGVSKQQYLDWIESGGTPRCGATTKEGHRCKNYVSGGIQRDIDDWVRLEGGYCAVHGGEASQRK